MTGEEMPPGEYDWQTWTYSSVRNLNADSKGMLRVWRDGVWRLEHYMEMIVGSVWLPAKACRCFRKGWGPPRCPRHTAKNSGLDGLPTPPDYKVALARFQGDPNRSWSDLDDIRRRYPKESIT
jgi:hypothetical protein